VRPQVPFFNHLGSEFVELLSAAGAPLGWPATLFEGIARKKAPCIIFIDELDASANPVPASMGRGSGGNDEREQTSTNCSPRMDGLASTDKPVNRAGRPPPARNAGCALLRPGRSDPPGAGRSARSLPAA